jgi:predicted enzyme related to lactoylglutathione lyase
MISGVAGAVIWTDDLDGMTRFYREALGLEPHSVRPHFVSFKFGDTRLGLGSHSRVEGKAKDPYRVMVNLAVEDIHRQYEAMVGAGVEFIRAPEKEHWGGWVSTFKDPDGNVVQLMEFPEGTPSP